MLFHYLKISFRSLRKYPAQSLVAMFSLAFGMACFVLSFYWFRYETTFDGFYPDAGNIYRIYTVEKNSMKINNRVPGILEGKLHEYFPEVEASTNFTLFPERYSYGEESTILLNTLVSDSTFLRLFPQNILCGDFYRPLDNPRSIVLTESVAVRMFGTIDEALGKEVKSAIYKFPPYTVTAVVKDPPANTNISFEAIHYPEIENSMIIDMPEQEQWGYFNKQLYVKFNAKADKDLFSERLRDFTSEIKANDGIELHTLPIRDVRHGLGSDLPFTLNFTGLCLILGFLLLLGSLFNFINLGIGLLRQKVKELRMRTVSGASGKQIIVQLLFQLLFMIMPALLLALPVVVALRLPFANLLGIKVELSRLIDQFIISGLFISLVILLVSAIPLWRIYRLSLKENPFVAERRSLLKHVAVVAQLIVSVVLIFSALVVMLQLHYVNKKDLGFDHESVIRLAFPPGSFVVDLQENVVSKLDGLPGITAYSLSDFNPQHSDPFMVTEIEWPGKSIHEKPAFHVEITDSRFDDVFDIKILDGRFWTENEKNKILINEEAVRVMGLEHPIGTEVSIRPGFFWSDGKPAMVQYEIIGVVKDFHLLSLRSPIRPAIFKSSHQELPDEYLYIRAVKGQEIAVMQQLSELLSEADERLSGTEIILLDDLYDRLNYPEQAGFKMFAALAVVCLLISLLGSYAVSADSARKRRKEIALRKVNGATVRDILVLFFREYAILVFVAHLIALPIAYAAMIRWLQTYAYHTDISWMLPISIFILIIGLVMLTVFGQVVKAARTNPAEVVKEEN